MSNETADLEQVNTEALQRQEGILSGDSSSPKDVKFYLQNNHTNNHLNSSASPISAIFLVQFDVRSGYELKWSKKVEDTISLKGVEFKSLPSGLHGVEREVISFVQPKDFKKGDQIDVFDNLFYGVSVYHQNLKDSIGQSRDNVRMFSLGILVDPFLQSSKLSSLSKLTSNLSWKPVDYTKGLEYIDELDKLLDDWDPKSEDYTDFEEFFNQHSTSKLVDQLLLQSPRTPRSLSKLTFESPDPSESHHSHHYLLKLPLLLAQLGPLVFKVWRSTLLREKVLLFDVQSVELSCAFSYCLSIISSIPQDLVPVLSESSSKINTSLRYVQPIYSVGVNDIDWLKSLKLSDKEQKGTHSFIASSTDEILLFKTSLYDIAVQFNALHDPATKIPRLLPAEASIPGSNVGLLKSTQRDLEKFKYISDIFDLYGDHQDLKNLDSQSEDFKWWYENTESASWTQLAWSGFYWWASAGEKTRVYEDPEYANLSEIDTVKGDIEKALFIVGYFQGMIRRIFNTVLDILRNEEASIKQGEEGDLLDVVLVVESSDLFEMGLDPYSNEDKDFVIRLIKTWWNRDAKIGSSLRDLCCF